MVLPHLSILARDVLVFLLIGIGVKRQFNIVRDIIIYRRSRLISTTIEVIMMIRYNNINNTYDPLTTNHNN